MMISLSYVQELLVQVEMRFVQQRFFCVYSICCSLYRRNSDYLSCTSRLKSQFNTLILLIGYFSSVLGLPPSDLQRLRWEEVCGYSLRRVSYSCFCEYIASFFESKFLFLSYMATSFLFFKISGLMSRSTMPITVSFSTLSISAQSEVQIALYSQGLSQMISSIPQTSDFPSTQYAFGLPCLVI